MRRQADWHKALHASFILFPSDYSPLPQTFRKRFRYNCIGTARKDVPRMKIGVLDRQFLMGFFVLALNSLK